MEQKKVCDLMLPPEEYATVPADCTIKEALISLSNAQLGLSRDRIHHRAVLVLDAGGNVIGKLSHWAIMRSLEPQFLKYDDEASLARAGLTEQFLESMKNTFSFFSGTLEQMCLAAARIKARDAMVPVRESIDKDEPLTTAIRQMVLQHVQTVLVTQRGSVVGILRLADVFEEIANIIRSSE